MRFFPSFIFLLYSLTYSRLAISQLDTAYVAKIKKNESAFIAIAHQDIYGTNIDFDKKNNLEKSFSAFGDKELVKEMILHSLIFNSDSPTTATRIDSAYALPEVCSSLPFVINTKLLSPFAMGLSTVACDAVLNKRNFYDSYRFFCQIQRDSFPHLPGGINDMPEYENPQDELKWIKKKGLDWLIHYPVEHQPFLRYYANYFNRWPHKDLDGNKHLSMLLQAVDSAQIGFVDSETILSIWGDKVGQIEHKPQIPTTIYMHNHPKAFVNEVYKNLLYRAPSMQELDFLVRYISTHTQLTSEIFYLSILTSIEYNFF